MASRFGQPIPPEAPRVPPQRAARLLGRMFVLAGPEWPRLFAGIVCLAIASAASLVLPQGIRWLVDGALDEGGARTAIDQAAWLLLAAVVVQGAATALRFVLFSIAGERTIARLRQDAYRRLLDQEIAFFDRHRTGDLASRLAADTSVLQSAVSTNLSMLLRNGAAVLGGLVMLLYTSAELTLLMLAVVPAVAIGAVIYGRRVRRLSRDVQDAIGQAAAIGEESLVGIRTVRAFAAEPTEARRYGDAVERSFEIAKKRAIVSGTFMGVAMFAAMGAAALVMWYGGGLVLDREMTIGQLTSFLVYTMLVAFSLGALGELWADFMRAAGAAERVFEILDRVPAIAHDQGLTPAEVAGRIELRGVDFAYPTRPDVPVLSGVDLVLEPGEVVAVVGPSGAGKSTLAALLTRFYDPGEGALLLDGQDLRDLDPRWLRRQIGVVAQEPLLFSSSVADNIRYGRADATDGEVEAAARAANAHEFVARFPDGYATKVGERGIQLSGGQKQRVAIARAVLKDPKLLILDEATSALDAESEHLVQEALDRLLEGRTTLVIAHRLSTVKNADRVVVLDAGKIVQHGTHAALVATDGLYRRLVERQLTGDAAPAR